MTVTRTIISQKARTISPKSLLQHMLLGEPNDQFDPHHWHSASFQTVAQLWNSNFNISWLRKSLSDFVNNQTIYNIQCMFLQK